MQMIIMDCCAAVEIARQTEVGAAMASLIDPVEEVVTPTWFRAEVRNAFWKYVQAGAYGEEEAFERIGRAEELITRFVAIDDYLQEAFVEAVRHNHSFYDMLYLCMTRRNAGTLFTTDKKLIELCIDERVNSIDVVNL